MLNSPVTLALVRRENFLHKLTLKDLQPLTDPPAYYMESPAPDQKALQGFRAECSLRVQPAELNSHKLSVPQYLIIKREIM